MKIQFFKRRALAICIDFIIVLFIASICIIPILVLVCGSLGIQEYTQSVIFASICMLMLSLKDVVFKGASIGKYLLKIRVICIDTYEPPTRKKLILRGLIVAPLYAVNITFMIFTGQLLADRIFKTTVDKRPPRR